MNIPRTASGSQTGPYKRVRLSYAGEPVNNNEHSTPAPAYTDTNLRRTKSSMPLRIIRHLTNRHEAQYDPNTVPLLSKREQRKAEKREQRKLEVLQAYQRKQFHDQISRQLEVNQSERESQPRVQPRRSVTQKVKDTLRKTRTGTRKHNSIQASTKGTLPALPTQRTPHVDDFLHKNTLQQWFHGPSDVEAVSAPAVTIEEPCPAELDATGISSPYHSFTGAVSKRHFDGSLDFESLPPPIRSPSPCLSALPQRGMTINETPAQLPGKQMQCDSCHDAIKMTGFHYVCTLCNEGDCLYCAKCANGGRTCRHELIERTRNIKRHPTNPQPISGVGRKMLAFDRDSVISSEAHVELSATHPHSILPPLNTQILQPPLEEQASSSRPQTNSHLASPGSPISPVNLLKDFEAKRREQEVAFREKEVTLREREAMLREREAWTASRERDAALVQQLHAAAMLQQRAEVGAQFPPRSLSTLQSSYGGSISRHPSSRSEFALSQSRPPSLSNRTSESPAEDITLHTSMKGKRPNVELASSVAAIEASFAGMEVTEAGIRTHANSTKRKSSPETKTHSSSSSTRKTGGASRRATSTRDNTDEMNDDEDDDTGSPKRQKQETHDQGEPAKLFACPYYKHHPVRYGERNTDELNYRSCATGLLRDISRVKQHLKRTHHRPDFYCRRCFANFDNNEQLQKHSSSRQGCDVRNCPYPERLDETQQAKIHVKKPGKHPRELWNEIFSVIFPGAPVPESPYIEQAQPGDGNVLPNLLEQFIESFNRRLTCASHSSQSWLGQPSVREFLNTQMLQTMQDVMRTQMSPGIASSPGDLASHLTSPMSAPTVHQLQSRHTSQSSSRTSSSPRHHRRQPQYLSPASAQPGLRPALKVATSMRPGTSSNSGESAIDSAFSHRSQSFPRVPRHVREDSGYDNFSSWASGDDVHVMGATISNNREPSSATSTRSTKSVSFVTPPQHMATWHDSMDVSYSTATGDEFVEAAGPNLFDFVNLDWSAQNFAGGTHEQQAPFSKPSYLRADSAYGTLSSAQASQNSLFQPQPNVHASQEQLTCVDPSKLSVYSTDVNLGGLSADVQAYLNRDMHGYFGA
ncbi:hypothetical protein LTR70_007945 [Exophiala xenobiotica]|uniref:C2H2-type domain-containing protein n=1 Tax=Lithohypha guttulata TaxID=1690604 RepID=A0ABR0K480_9EURO|nr:hypothetical protein LTR24_007505 [Lithohypha guttulata]KAK5312863.1 hypothetical protein LTR70_007945 [Exophiala xenobiotica]